MAGVASGVRKNLSRACCVLEADGAQAGESAGAGDAGLKLSLVWEADSRGVAWPWGVAGRGSVTLGVTAGRGLTATVSCADDDHPVWKPLVTRTLALSPTGPTVSLGPAGLPMGTWEEVVARGSAAAWVKTLAVELPATGPVFLCPRTSWAFWGELRGLGSVGTAPGGLGSRLGNLGLAEVAVGWWLEQTKTPGSAVAR